VERVSAGARAVPPPQQWGPTEAAGRRRNASPQLSWPRGVSKVIEVMVPQELVHFDGKCYLVGF